MTLPRFPALSETNNLGDLLKYEAPNLYSREQLPVAPGQILALGAVIGITTSTGKAKAVDPSATDGSQFAAGVLLQAVDASGATSTNAPVVGITVVRHAMVADHALVWPTGITAAEKLAALQQLQNLGVLARKGI
jgi:hypothetical protein